MKMIIEKEIEILPGLSVVQREGNIVFRGPMTNRPCLDSRAAYYFPGSQTQK